MELTFILGLWYLFGIAKSGILLPPVEPLNCYVGHATKMTQSTLQLTECPGPNPSCLVSRLQVELLGIKMAMDVGQCATEFTCKMRTCDVVETLVSPLFPEFGGLTVNDCKTSCCKGNACNEPQKTFGSDITSMSVSLEKPARKMRCYSGSWQDDEPKHSVSEFGKKEITCGRDSEICMISRITMEQNPGKTITVNTGQCVEKSACSILSCETFLQIPTDPDTKIISCNLQCCNSTDLCNTVTMQFGDELGLSPPPSEYSSLDSLPTIELSNGNPIVLLAEPTPHTCYAGSWTQDDVSARRVETCETGMNACLLTRFSVDIRPGFSVTSITGQCVPEVACTVTNCGSLEESMAPLIMTACDIRCCKGNLCNTHEITKIPNAIMKEMPIEKECKQRRRSHNACCGDRSYNFDLHGCCTNDLGIRKSTYRKGKQGCCNGVTYSLLKKECINGEIQIKEIYQKKNRQ